MIVVDASAIIAILRMEPEARDFLQALAEAESVEMSALSVVEVGMVLAGALGDTAEWAPFRDLMERAEIVVVPLDEVQARLALDAFLRFGKGRHPAALNLGDCASYALASSRGAEIVFKGEDFARTDLKPAVVALHRH